MQWPRRDVRNADYILALHIIVSPQSICIPSFCRKLIDYINQTKAVRQYDYVLVVVAMMQAYKTLRFISRIKDF